MRPSFIVHGGAGSISGEELDASRQGLHRALATGWAILSSGGAAIDAVEACVAFLEDDPAFNAGFGARLNLEGRAQLDAMIMDGGTLKAGAVAAVERIRNPIRLARRILEKSPHMLLVAEGAEEFAEQNGMALCAAEDLVREQERIAWQRCRQSGHAAEHHRRHEQGTVGAVALDGAGKIVAATSTGGICCKFPGRVGDSPLIGCGCYADAEAGGVSCTGSGEGIMKIVMAKMAADLLRGGGGAQDVAEACVRRLNERTGATGGLILLDREGQPAAAFNTPEMTYGYVQASGAFYVA